MLGRNSEAPATYALRKSYSQKRYRLESKNKSKAVNHSQFILLKGKEKVEKHTVCFKQNNCEKYIRSNLTARSNRKLSKIKELMKNQPSIMNEFFRKKTKQFFPHFHRTLKTEGNEINLIKDPDSNEKVKLRGLIGEGNFGKVYRAYLASKPCEEITVKKILVDPEHISREEQFAKSLNNLFIVKFYGTYESFEGENEEKQNKTLEKKKCLNILMEKYDMDLKTYLSQKSQMSAVTIKLFIYQMLRALHYVHSQQICHRDIKLDNFLIKGFKIVLCDFGSSKRIQNKSKKVQNCESNATYLFQRCYRAPELLLDYDKYDSSVDIWALGCVISEMLTGSVLFNGQNVLDQLVKIMRIVEFPKWKQISFLKKSNQTLPKLPPFKSSGLESRFHKAVEPKLILLLKKMLQFDPEKRISAIEALCDGYFSQLREEYIWKQFPKGANIPNIFYFTKRQIFGNQHLLSQLIPFWVKEHCKRNEIDIKNFKIY